MNHITATSPPPTSLAAISSRGVAIIDVTNGAQFGLPNLSYDPGPFDFTTDLNSDTLVSVARMPHVKLDICAALS